PKAAAANPSIFFDNGGNARSVAGVYAVLDARYSAAANSKATQSAMAAVGGVAATSVVDNAAYLSSFPNARSVTPVLASSSSSQAGNAPIFRSLFQAGDRAEPVSPAVQELWGRGTSLTSDMSASSAAPRVRAPQPLDLFSDRFGAFSS
ncbi:MAG: hypothetical protein JWR29_547, partial [Tardiphaga sp.]|nr:hypothetical protein [Tardiphaga sp.]